MAQFINIETDERVEVTKVSGGYEVTRYVKGVVGKAKRRNVCPIATKDNAAEIDVYGDIEQSEVIKNADFRGVYIPDDKQGLALLKAGIVEDKAEKAAPEKPATKKASKKK